MCQLAVARHLRRRKSLQRDARARMTAGRSIDYDALTQDALRGIARTVLQRVAKSGLPGDHHFYIAFDTQAPGVILSRRLKEKYPEEMMIVLQHRFWDLAVADDYFEVKLTFEGIPERLVVPFQAMRVFFDPSVRFTLQFGEALAGDDSREGGAPRRRRKESEPADAAGCDRRPRNRSRPRPEPVAEDEAVSEAQQPAAVEPDASPVSQRPVEKRSGEATPLRPVPVPAAAPAVAPADAAPPAAAPQPGGAKVFSLDQFRKK